MQRADDEMSSNSTKLNEKGEISNACFSMCTIQCRLYDYIFCILHLSQLCDGWKVTWTAIVDSRNSSGGGGQEKQEGWSALPKDHKDGTRDKFETSTEDCGIPTTKKLIYLND